MIKSDFIWMMTIIQLSFWHNDEGDLRMLVAEWSLIIETKFVLKGRVKVSAGGDEA